MLILLLLVVPQNHQQLVQDLVFGFGWTYQHSEVLLGYFGAVVLAVEFVEQFGSD